MLSLKSVSIIVLLFLLVMSPIANSQVTEQRRGEANPMITIAKATMYGAATGVLLGLAGLLVIDEPFWDIMKWGFVGGTGGGFLIGVIYVVSRPSPGGEKALLEFDRQGLARVSLPNPDLTMHPDRSVDIEVQLLKIRL